ncbi:hypothetical protein GGR58DRAFT_520604 [Xylaria digitata]|nr:hypothetical protein GGR58DRAFT_520604 [Xylaria digitata]
MQQAYDCIADLKKAFALLDDKLQSVRTANPASDLPTRAAECLTACTEGLRRLEKTLGKLHKANPNGFAQKAHADALRLVYPFRASTLEKLKKPVRDLMGHLKLAIQVLLLENSRETGKTVARVEDGIGGIESLATKIHVTALDTQVQTGIAAVGVQVLLKAEEKERLRKVLKALEAPDQSINHDEARGKHEAGTGEWFLKCQNYQNWRRLSSQPASVLGYFYFSFSDLQKQSYISRLLSLVAELSQGSAVHPKLLAAYDQNPRKRPGISILEEVLIAQLRRSRTSYFVIDALDECPESGDERERVMQGLERIAKRSSNARVLQSTKSVNADIDIFVKNTLATDKKLLKLPDKTKVEIEHMFHKKSDGMFRWAARQLQSIRNLKILRPSYISAALHDMPRGLDETYERMLGAIDEMYHDEVRFALEWLTFSERPLSVAELAEACSIRLDDTNNPSLEEFTDDTLAGLLSVLSPLILAEQGPMPEAPDPWRIAYPLPMKFSPTRYAQRIRLAHFSVKEYLRCCAYLLSFTNQREIREWIDKEEPPEPDYGVEWGSLWGQDFLDDFTPSYPLLSYVIHIWMRHQALAEDQATIPETGPNFHLTVIGDERVRILWLRLAASNTNNGIIEYLTDWHDGTIPLYWASLLGFHRTVSMLCERASYSEVNHVSGQYGTAIQATAYSGAEKIVERLLQAGAIVNAQGGAHGTALQAAVYMGHERVVRILIQAGADVNIAGGDDWAALCKVLHDGEDEIVKLLIEAGADVNPALCQAIEWWNSSQRQMTWVKFLLANGADINGQFNILLDHGVDVNAQDEEYGNVLAAASFKRYEKIVQMLLDKDANVNDQGGWFGNALQTALYGGHNNIVGMLINRGAVCREEWRDRLSKTLVS